MRRSLVTIWLITFEKKSSHINNRKKVVFVSVHSYLHDIYVPHDIDFIPISSTTKADFKIK